MSTGTGIAGHGLWSEGWPVDATPGHGQGWQPGRFRSDVGRALCECGEMSPVLDSAAERKRWHRDVHKAEIRRAMNGTRPILAVDVDGVLNACSRGANPPRGWADTRAMGFRIRYNPAHGARLLDIAEATGAELVWCTTWEGLANEHIGPLVGLPALPFVPLDDARREASRGLKFSQSPSTGNVKAAAIRAWAGDRPFCWLDDEPDAASELASHPVPHLVVQPRTNEGLQEHHFRRAAEWLSALSSERVSTDG